jgi:two-component system sensor histidine kinase KdpD
VIGRALLPYAGSAVAVAALAGTTHLLTRFLPLPHVSILFMAAVLTSAALWGFWPSVFAAVLSVAASMYFFYSPIFDFRVAAAQDIADLGVFLVVASATSRLAANVRAKALEARRQQRNVARLLAFNERVAGASDEPALARAIAEELAANFGGSVHLLRPEEGALSLAASCGTAALAGDALAAAQRIADGHDATLAGWRFERLATAQGLAGVVASQDSHEPSDPEYVKALLGQAALAIERAALQRKIAEASIRRHGEALREALLNSVSHDLRTPLAAILGSATALESLGEQVGAGARSELVGAIRGETERLQSYIDNVLDLTRIRAGQITPRLELVEFADIVNAALRRKQKALSAHSVQVDLPPELPMLKLDLFLMEHALANVLDNAAKYAPAASRIRIGARLVGGEVVARVEDEGSGIRGEQLPHVFDAFYRGRATGAQPAGTGLGLAICRAFVEANGGTASAASAGPGAGFSVEMRLPVPLEAAIAMEADDD